MNPHGSIALNPFFTTLEVMTLGERLQHALDLRGRDAPSLIAALGVSKGAIYNILNDTTTPEKVWGSTVLAISMELGVSWRWLLTGRGPVIEAAAAAANDDWTDITGYAQAVGLGKGAEAQEYAETHKLKFRADSLARKRLRPDKLAVMYGDGDSMEPRIRPGDAILFDTSDTRPRDGALFVVQLGREIYVKRCEIIDETVYFRADNPNGDHQWRKPKRLDSDRLPIQILGRVRWVGSWEE